MEYGEKFSMLLQKLNPELGDVLSLILNHRGLWASAPARRAWEAEVCCSGPLPSVLPVRFA